MARVTSKRQVTIPKTIADAYGISTGDELDFLPAGDAISVRRRAAGSADDVAARLASFDRATARQRERDPGHPSATGEDRGWTRAELYERGRAR